MMMSVIVARIRNYGCKLFNVANDLFNALLLYFAQLLDAIFELYVTFRLVKPLVIGFEGLSVLTSRSASGNLK